MALKQKLPREKALPPEPTSPSAKPPRRAGYWLVALALAAVLLYYSLRGVDWRHVWILLREADLAWVGATLALMSGALVLRSQRWRMLLIAGAPISSLYAFWATSVGYLGNSFLPARAGEILRTVVVSRHSGLSKTFVLMTVLCERLLDAVSLILIGALVLLQLPERPGWLEDAARPLAIGGMVGVAGLVMVPLFEPFWVRLLEKLPVPDRFRGFAEHLLEQGLKGMRSLHAPWRLTKYILLTAIIWAMDGVVMVAVAKALSLQLSWAVALLVVVGLGLGSALPSTPGYVGIWQFVAVTLLTPFGFTRSDAIAFILMFQAVSYAIFLLWGLLGVSQTSPGLLKRRISEPLA
jgi:uncharacterized membrane protein YbhN (UPF0104 family)